MPKPRVTKNIATISTAHFQRQELKYFVSNHLIDALIPEFNAFIERDRFSKFGPYEIHSIYFDTEDWQAFYSKLDGNQRRQKFRIRSYILDPSEEDNVFIEVKEKYNGTIFKRRSPIKFKDAKTIITGARIEKDSPIVEEWRYGVLKNSLKARLLNSYTRFAFSSEHFPGLRVTIDQNLSFTMTNSVDFTQPTRNAYWSYGKSVVEIKFDRYVPQFIIDIIRRYNLTQVPVSKYCDSVISHYLLL